MTKAPKKSNNGKLSLFPMKYEDAVRHLLTVKPTKKEKQPKKHK